MQSTRPVPSLIAVSVVLSVAIFVAVGRWADRLMFAHALRAVRRANRSGIFDAKERKAFLAKRGARSAFFFIWLFGFAPFLAAPYLGFLFAFLALADLVRGAT